MQSGVRSLLCGCTMLIEPSTVKKKSALHTGQHETASLLCIFREHTLTGFQELAVRLTGSYLEMTCVL